MKKFDKDMEKLINKYDITDIFNYVSLCFLGYRDEEGLKKIKLNYLRMQGIFIWLKEGLN